MDKVRIGSGNAARVGRLLREIAQGRGLPDHLRHTADSWASEIHRTMARQDLRELVWLLHDAGSYRWKPASGPDKARYWAAYLEGRIR